MTTPFYPTAVTYPGADPGVDPTWRTGDQRFWLGKPGNMIQLPSPNPADYTANLDMGEVEQELYGGAAGLTRFGDAVRRWQISWPRLAGRDWQIVHGFYRRLFGAGPWAFLPPDDVNRLTLRQSMCGAVAAAVEGWATTAGTLAYAAAQVSRVAPCGVMQWSPGAISKFLVPGALSGVTPVPDVNRALVHIPSESVAVSCWMKAVTTAASVQPALRAASADGLTVSTVTGSTTAVPTTGWTQVAMLVAPGALTFDPARPYLLPLWQSMNANAVYVTTPQISYTDSHLDWEAGAGLPRVIWPATAGRGLDPHMNSAVAMILAESVLGAA